MDYVGIDLHKRESQICVLGEDGEVIEKRIQTRRDRFIDFFGRFPKGTRILVEASTESEWVARCLEELGHELIVGDPNFALMYATRAKRVKTDRRDARALADACKAGTYRRSHRSNDEDRGRKALLLARMQLVRMRTRSITVVRSLLRQHGVHATTGAAETFARRMRGLDMPTAVKLAVEPLLATLDALAIQIDSLEERLEKIVKDDPRVKRLTTVYGVGPVTAVAFAAAIGDASRFESSRKAAAYLGLTPGEASSGDTKRRTSITKTGSTMVRTLLVQAALTIMRTGGKRAPVLHAWAHAIAQRRNSNVARIALARKLACILHVMLRNDATFDPLRGMQSATAA